MKLLSESDQRLQDRIDLQHLIAAATDQDLADVPPLLDPITQRGFDRDKDLRKTSKPSNNIAKPAHPERVKNQGKILDTPL